MRIEKKERAVTYKGGACIRCGYNKCLAALEFHHIDPTTKEVLGKELRSKTWEVIKAEIDKCILLCSNCHKEEHEFLRNSRC